MEPALFIVALALSTVTGSRAEESLFVREGGSVRLDVLRYEDLHFSVFTWQFNSSTTVLKYSKNNLIIFGDYEITTEFNKKNFSLLLKNVQQNDGGIYKAQITDENGDQKDVAKYRITVQEALPIPQMRLTLISSAGGFCNVSVNCSSKDTWASYTCEDNYCTQVANTTSPTGVNINVMEINGTLHCRTSNKVDTKSQSESTRSICLLEKNNGDSSSQFSIYIIIVIAIAIAIAMAIVIFIYIYYKRKKNSEGSEINEQVNTEYASVQGLGVHNKSTEVTVYESVTNAKPERRLEVTTVYDMVTLRSAEGTSAIPESIYATVNKDAS